MPTLVVTPKQVGPGGHGLALHVGEEEGAAQAAEFLAGAPPTQPARFWVSDAERQRRYQARVAEITPEHVGCVAILDEEQVRPMNGHLRPVETIAQFVSGHPDGVTGAADTLDRHWSSTTVPNYLEYEAWFQAQSRDASRFLCPYDLRRLPSGVAPQVLRELGRHHSHVVLSESQDPAVLLLELFVFGRPEAIPPRLAPALDWARRCGYVRDGRGDEDLALTEAGERLVRTWSDSATVDW